MRVLYLGGLDLPFKQIRDEYKDFGRPNLRHFEWSIDVSKKKNSN